MNIHHPGKLGDDGPVFQYVSLPGRSYKILVPVPQQISKFHERFDLAITTERVTARGLCQYGFHQESAPARFSERVRLEIAPNGDSIDIVIQGTVGCNTGGESVLLALHRVIVQTPAGSEGEVENDIASGHYPFRSRPIANTRLFPGSSLQLTRRAFDTFWVEIDSLLAWGFRGPIDGASPPEGAFTFAQAIEQSWCQYRSPARFLSFLTMEQYPYFESGFITELGFNRLMAQKKTRRTKYKVDWQKTNRSNARRRGSKTSLGADSHGKEPPRDAVKEKFSCPQK